MHHADHTMRTHLRNRILASLTLVTGAFLAITWWIQQQALLPSFVELERQHAVRNLDRGTEALTSEIEHLSDFVGDWSGWDDTYKFVADGNADFLKSNLESDVFRESSFDFLCFLRPDGSEVWRSGLVDGVVPTIDQLPAGRWPTEHALLATPALTDVRTAVIVTGHGPLLLASRPITDSARTAPQRGWIIMGRFLTVARTARLAEQTRLQLRVLPAAQLSDSVEVAAYARLRTEGLPQLDRSDAEHMTASALVPGLVSPRDDLLVQVVLPRAILAQGQSALRSALWTTALAICLVFAVLVWLLQRMVVGPLVKLTQHALEIRASADLTRRSGVARSDEIGTLAHEFDSMVERLAASQTQLLEQARAGGMSEVATSVLHDVGNAMQAVQASAGCLREHLRSRNVSDLERVSRLLVAQADELAGWLTSDAKGRQVPAFLVGLADGLAAEHDAMTRELALLAAGLEHIGQLVDRQRQHSGQRGAIEALDATAMLKEAARIAGAEAAGVDVAVEVIASGPLHAERHKLLAVLINLVRNACEAVADLPPERRALRLTATDAEPGRIRFAVEDRGVGIAADDLRRVFQGGWTSKGEGRGVGLHGAANSVREMDGRLWAESDGPGCGARFLVELPSAAGEPCGAAP